MCVGTNAPFTSNFMYCPKNIPTTSLLNPFIRTMLVAIGILMVSVVCRRMKALAQSTPARPLVASNGCETFMMPTTSRAKRRKSIIVMQVMGHNVHTVRFAPTMFGFFTTRVQYYKFFILILFSYIARNLIIIFIELLYAYLSMLYIQFFAQFLVVTVQSPTLVRTIVIIQKPKF